MLSTCKKPLSLFAGKKSTSSPILYWRCCKYMQTSYLEYFGHAWLHTLKMIVSTCTRLWCLSVCRKQTPSFTSFLRYYILKMTKFFKKSKNNLFWGHFGSLLQILRQKWIFLEKRPLSLLRYSSYLSSYQKSEKTIDQFLRKTPYWRTDRQTDDSEFIRPSVGKFLVIICLVYTQNCSKYELSPPLSM